ncbi:MAG TPA: hypothetical protein VMT10_04890 [Solirubrobacteraceae bacterium]|nr:hypothetical protein [Solirubrobacteraceae bacterium]
MRCLLAAGVVATLAVSTPIASAATWSTPARLTPACPHGTPLFGCLVEPAPRIALDAGGSAVVAWSTRGDRIGVALARRAGRFGRPVDLGPGLRPAVVLGDARATVVWTRRHSLYVSRAGADGRFSTPRQLIPPGSKIGDDFAHLAAQPGGSIVVAYTNAFREPSGKYTTRLRAVTLSATGAVGPVRDLGNGFLDHDSFRAGPGGRAVICCLDTPLPPGRYGQFRTAGAVFTPGAGWRRLDPPLGPRLAVETVAVGDGPVAWGTIDVKRSGDAGLLGVPGVIAAQASGVFGPPLAAALTGPSTRGLHPVVAVDGSGRVVLVFQQKTAPRSFDRRGPVWATTGPTVGPLAQPIRLDASLAYQPTVRAYGRGAVAAWATGAQRWGVAVERGGVFRPAAAPPGRPSTAGEDFSYNRDLAAAGRYAGLAWVDSDGSVMASVGTP